MKEYDNQHEWALPIFIDQYRREIEMIKFDIEGDGDTERIVVFNFEICKFMHQ